MTKNSKKQKIIRLLITLGIVMAIIAAIYLPLKLSGALSKIDSAEKLKEVILSGGSYSYLLFFLLQFLQVTLLPIPAAVTTIAGTLVFGPLLTFILSFVAVMLGSAFAFFLGRKVGRKAVYWILGEEEALKWEKTLEKGKYTFFLMLLFPIFPDDVLCLVVGMTAMSWRFFIVSNLITRPISLLALCYLTSGEIIPFSGYGIPIWIALGVILLAAAVLSFVYQEKIEKFMLDKFSRRKKENNDSQDSTDTDNKA